MVSMVIEGATIKLLFKMLMSYHIAHAFLERIVISPRMDTLHPSRKSLDENLSHNCLCTY